MKPIRAVVAGTDSDMLANLLRHLLERDVPLDVVARIAHPEQLASVSREEKAELALLCTASAVSAATVETLRRDLGSAALVVVEKRGQEAWSRTTNPGLGDLVRMIITLCRPSDSSVQAEG